MSRHSTKLEVMRTAVGLASVSCLLGLAACQPNNSRASLTAEDFDAWHDWSEQQEYKEVKAGFKAVPLHVDAVGKVEALPDIAVITARVSAKDLNESRALDEVVRKINDVQTALKTQEVETGFTSVRSAVKMDQSCLNENNQARERQGQITTDYWFNQRLDNRGDTETERREAKPRLAESICDVETIEVTTHMVVRVSPASEAGTVLKAFGDAKVSSARLYGYDFSDYDALYQEAAEKAVKAARKKAEMIARVAQTELGEITSFRVNGPARTGRFGPQPSVVNRHQGVRSGFAAGYSPPIFETVSETVVVQEASAELVTIPATYETVTETVVVQPSYRDGDGNFVPAVTKQISRRVVKTPASTRERTVPAVTKQETRRVIKVPAGASPAAPNAQSNALQMSLLSGPQTISVAAYLSYDYKTPIDGSVVPDDEN